ncbi:MAG: HDOD domain-containing protein [Deltaproteobacteria bacterium]|nr:MAG: HDOD domain-containing protein [Deltaproteobacteria bacterium]
MANLPLTAQIDNMVASGRVHLPVYPAVAAQVDALLAQDTPTADTLARLISHDPVLACNLFRAANSAFYQGLPKALTIDEAITRVGIEQTLREVERACRDGELCPQGQFIPRYFSALWQHALGCALGARWLAHRCGFAALAEQAHLQGLLHDIGKLFLLAALEQIAGCDEPHIALGPQLVEEVVESMHVEMGLRLITEWHLPDEFAGVVGRHHEAELDGQELLLALVRLANKGCRKVGLGWERDDGLVLPTTAEAQFLGIDEISLAEFEIMLEDRFQLVAPEPA